MATVYGNVNPSEGSWKEKVYLTYTISETGSKYTITCKAGVNAYTEAIKITGKETWADTVHVSINDVAYASSTETSGAHAKLTSISLAKGASKQLLSKTYTYTKSKNGTTSKTIRVASDIEWLGYATVYSGTGIFEESATTQNSSYKSQAFTIPKRTSYTIKYNANGGTGAPTSGTKWADEAYTVSSTTPTRAGYTFSKWMISQTGTTVSAGGTISASSNNSYTLIAQWNANTNTVQYNANGGTNAPTSQTGKTASTITLTSNLPSRVGYDFVGWATSATGSAAYYAGGSYKVGTAATQTLYAVWKSNYVAPTISNLTATRAVYESGTWSDNDDGNKLHVKWNYTVGKEDSTVSLPQTYKVGYKVKGTSTYTYSSVTGTDGVVDTYLDVPIIAENMYDIQAVIEVGQQAGGPSHPTPITRTTYVSKAYYIIDINSDGTGIAFGVASTQAGFECKMPAYFDAVYIRGHSSAVGAVVRTYLSADKSVPNSTYTELCSIALEAGSWVVNCGVRWETNTTGYRRCNLSTTSGSSNNQLTVAPVTGSYTQMSLTRVITVADADSPATFYLNGYQNSGSSLAVKEGSAGNVTYITAIRIR